MWKGRDWDEEMINKTIAQEEEWLTREDNACRQDRLARLKWIVSRSPGVEYWIFSGGQMSKYLFDEARYCFVYGQFLATIVLGLSYIEHTLASLFYASGRNDLERANISTLLQEALNYEWIDQAEFDNLQHVRRIRNPVTHFRKPLDRDRIEYRFVTENVPSYAIIEEDARHVMESIFRLLGKSGI